VAFVNLKYKHIKLQGKISVVLFMEVLNLETAVKPKNKVNIEC